MVETGYRKDLVVPLIDRVEVIHDMREVKQLTDLEHTCLLLRSE